MTIPKQKLATKNVLAGKEREKKWYVDTYIAPHYIADKEVIFANFSDSVKFFSATNLIGNLSHKGSTVLSSILVFL